MHCCVEAIAALALEAGDRLRGLSPQGMPRFEDRLDLAEMQVIGLRRRLIGGTTPTLLGRMSEDFMQHASRHYQSIRIVALDGHDHDRVEAASFGGGCRWNILGQTGNNWDVWQVLLHSQQRRRTATLRLTHRIPKGAAPIQPRGQASVRLLAALADAILYARNHQLAGLEALLSAMGLLASTEDVLPAGLNGYACVQQAPRAARRLAEAIRLAWVFHRHDPWVRPAEAAACPETFGLVSDTLYRRMCEALAAAVNDMLATETRAANETDTIRQTTRRNGKTPFNPPQPPGPTAHTTTTISGSNRPIAPDPPHAPAHLRQQQNKDGTGLS